MNGRTNSSDVTIQNINYGALIPLEPATDLNIVRGDGSAYLSWTDPVDKYASPGGELVAQYDHTRIIRKTDSAPTSPDDGVLVLETASRDQFKTEMFHDTGLSNRTMYYYGIYPYTTFGIPSEGISNNVLPSDGNGVYFNDIEFVHMGSPGGNSDITSTTRYYMAAGPTYNHLIFAGGQECGYKSGNSNSTEYGMSRLADAYDSTTLTRSNAAGTPTTAASMVRTSNGKYVIFGSGAEDTYGRPSTNGQMIAYNDALTVQNLGNNSLSGRYGKSYTAPIISEKYAMFGGGGTSRSETNLVYAFNQSLTKQTSILTKSRYGLGGAIINDTYIFAGGAWYAGISTDDNTLTDAFNSSLTKISITNLSSAFDGISYVSGGSIGDYAIFFSVSRQSSDLPLQPFAEAFDTSLTKVDASTIMQLPTDEIPSNMSIDQSNNPGVTFGNHVYFRYLTPSQVVFAKYDKNLTASKIKISDLIPNTPINDEHGMGTAPLLNVFDIVGLTNNQYALACFTVRAYGDADPASNRMAALTI